MKMIEIYEAQALNDVVVKRVPGRAILEVSQGHDGHLQVNYEDLDGNTRAFLSDDVVGHAFFVRIKEL